MNQPFHFPDGRSANDAQDLLELCEQYPDDATNFLINQDLEKWLAYIGSYDIAECATNARQTDMGDRQKLEDFLNKFHSLTAPEPAPAAVTETNIKDNLTAPESATTTTKAPPEKIESSPSPVATESLEPATPPKPASLETAAKTPTTSSSTTTEEEKPSFFQVVAKFIVKILYRNKA